MSMVDVHVHVFPRVSKWYPREVSELAPAEREAPVEQLLDTMEGAGVSKAVLIQLGGYGENHRYLADCLKRFPERFAGVGLVDPASPDPAEELTELVKATAVRGVRLNRLGKPGTGRVTELPSYPLWKRCAELGVAICIYAHADQAGFLEPLIREFQNVRVAFDHLGVCPTNFSVDRLRRPRIETELPPPTMQTILALAKYRNVYVKLSGDYAFSHLPYPYPDMRPVYRLLYEAYGAERLMWGTDFPWILEEPGYKQLTKLIDFHLPDLKRREREAILGETASRFWHL
ncbi:MAG: amidohydrolase family protein [Candidatus Bathyarchaeia archaeon]